MKDAALKNYISAITDTVKRCYRECEGSCPLCENDKCQCEKAKNLERLKELAEYRATGLTPEQIKETRVNVIKNIISELEKVPTEYRHEEYNQAVWDVMRWLERSIDVEEKEQGVK